MRILNIKGIRATGPLKDRIDLRIGRQATDDKILTFHTPAYLEEIKAADAKPEPVRIDGGSTVVADGTFESAMAAAGTPLDALHAVVNEPGGPVYTLVRPPGHHAQPTLVDDFDPAIIIIAAGENASAFDPNGRMVVTMDCRKIEGTFELPK